MKMEDMISVKVEYLCFMLYVVLKIKNLIAPVFRLLVQHYSGLYPDPFRLRKLLFRTSKSCNYAYYPFGSLKFRLIKYLFRSHSVYVLLPTFFSDTELRIRKY